MTLTKTTVLALAAGLCLTVLAGCGGGSAATASTTPPPPPPAPVTGIATPTQVSVVTAKNAN